MSMISVVVCTYNRCESLKDTLQSLLSQRIAGRFTYEVIVVDNNSRDETKTVFTSFQSHTSIPLRYVFEENQGVAHARNRGIEEAQGDIIAFTDDDCIPDIHWLQNIHAAFEQYDCVGVGGKVLVEWLGQKVPCWMDEKNPKAYSGLTCFQDLGDLVVNYEVDVTAPVTANFAIKKSAFTKYGFFDASLGRMGKNLGLGGEDYDYANRLLAAHVQLLFVPNIQVHHKVLLQRLNAQYLRRWHFSFGKAKVLRSIHAFEGVYLFRAPRYLYRLFFSNLWKSVLSYIVLRVKEGYLWELKARWTAGEICGYRSQTSLIKKH